MKYPRTINVDECLHIDPFEGDFGTGDEYLFSDKLVVARKDHECMICGSTISVGMLHRARREKYEGYLGTYRYCYLCCVAQAVCYQEDNTDLLESRYCKGTDNVHKHI